MAVLFRACLKTVLLSFVLVSPALAQGLVPLPADHQVNLSGPRFGLTLLSQGNIDKLKENDINVRPLLSQFGWQFERQLFRNDDGVTALMEWVPLLSGLDQGVALPSLNWLVGVRTRSGTEFGIGPNITPIGVGLVIAAGVTVRSGTLNVPLNFAIASSKSGVRVTILTGFNMRR